MSRKKATPTRAAEPEDAIPWEPAPLLALARVKGHRMTEFAPITPECGYQRGTGDFRASCTRRGCHMCLEYWLCVDWRPGRKGEPLYQFVDRSATLACTAARSRRTISPEYRAFRRAQRREWVRLAEEQGHEFGPWEHWWLSWVKHTLCFHKTCRYCQATIDASLCAPYDGAEGGSRLASEAGSSYRPRATDEPCTGRKVRQLALF